MESATELLVPRPKVLAVTDERLVLPPSSSYRIDAGGRRPDAAVRLWNRELEHAGQPPAGAAETADLRLCLDPGAGTDPESYRLTIGRGGVDVVAPAAAGLFYGVATLVQWLRLHAPADDGAVVLPGLRVDDGPDFRHRGVMLDVSRDRVPGMETLRRLVDLWAGLKINQVQLYTEHTFAYRGHETVWRDASPLTPGEVRELDALCREQFIELVPSQNSFGHFHRWLIHEPYRRLAECPEGVDHPFSLTPEPFSLCATDPGSPELLADLYDQLLPCFSSGQLNAGLDETLDLGRGRSAAACAERGRARVYLDFVRRVHALARERGRRIQMWGDVVLEHPELIAELPEDVVVLEWGYEGDHPFAEDCPRFAEAGREFYVCPGTSSWNSLAGRSRNAVLNLANAAVHGRAHRASGYLVTDWGDHGHLQPLPVSYPGYLAGAGFAWNVAPAREPLALPLDRLLDAHVFRDRAGVTGGVTTGLGNAYLEPGARTANGSALFFALVFALTGRERERTEGMSVATLERTLEYVDCVMTPLPRARMTGDDVDVVSRELGWAADALRLSCRLSRARLEDGVLGSFDVVPRRLRRELVAELDRLIEGHRLLWLARSRPGGLADSAARLVRVRDRLLDF
ncbi:MAG: family 20 glycosylhydrolase [bacterium]|nr:family 20 glycosylhydrolase [bacterium]